MAEFKSGGRRFWVSLSADAGASDEFVFAESAAVRALSVTIHSGAAGVASLAVSCRHPDDIAAGNADWTDVDFGGETDITGSDGAPLPAAVQAIRLTAVTEAARANVIGIV